MDALEILVVIAIGTMVVLCPIVGLVLGIIAYVRSRRITDLVRRQADLELRVQWLAKRLGQESLGSSVSEPPTAPSAPMTTAVSEPGVAESWVEAAVVVEDQGPAMAGSQAATIATSEPENASLGWEMFIGQKAFGWLAVVLFGLAATFFLRYAYQNNWIGPVGRVALGEIVGAALIVAGWRHFRQDWKRFATMLNAAGVIVLYLSTYSAFGFYRLLPQQHAGFFLTVLVIETMVVAVQYRSLVMALVAVLGGLVTPLLMHTDHDTYPAFFTYLAVLNLGVVLAVLVRPWKGVGSVAYFGSQLLYWVWYAENYHPEKFWWALGMQATLFGLYLGHDLIAMRLRRRPSDWEGLVRFVVAALIWFAAYYGLTRADYREWLGPAALVMAVLYAVVARWVLSMRPGDPRLLLTSVSLAVGFVAWSFPIQADARWVAFGWAAMGTALWWFGLRIQSAVLRCLAASFALLAIWRVLGFDMPTYVRDPFVPIFNSFALPSLGVAVLILTAVLLTPRFRQRLSWTEGLLVDMAGVLGLLLIWLVLSVDLYGYLVTQSIGTTEIQLWRWRGQLALTVFWTAYATLLLASGFWLRRVRMRWLGMVMFGVTLLKVFVVDMANVQQIYRILAFFVLAVVLALVARAYQRFK